jgi:two-component system, LuxR family, response regulator FixJ
MASSNFLGPTPADHYKDAMFVSSRADQPMLNGDRGVCASVPRLHVLGQDDQCSATIRSVSESLGLIVTTHNSGESLLRSYSAGLSGCLVTELQLPGMDVFELLREFKTLDKFVPLIVATRHADVRTAVSVIQAGALTLLETPLGAKELEEAIGEALLLEQRCRDLISHKREIAARLAELTDQEKTVLQLIVDGCPNKSIASKLDVSLRTVEGRRREVFNKLHANSLAEAVRLVTEVDREICVCRQREPFCQRN